MKSINSKYLTVLLSALIPSSAMALTSYFVKLKESHTNILKSFTAGLLLFSGFNILNDKEDNKTTIISFIVSMFILMLRNKKNDSLISSLYFESISDGMLLGALLNNIKHFKEFIPIILSLSIEMSITTISAVNELKKENVEHYKEKVIFSAVILGLSILVGYAISRNVNKDIMYGMGSASMLWLSIAEFITKIKMPSNIIYIFIGIVTGMFFE